MRFGESCSFSLNGRCRNPNCPHSGIMCPFRGKQFECNYYNSLEPRITRVHDRNKQGSP